jgi:hypothetical protein
MADRAVGQQNGPAAGQRREEDLTPSELLELKERTAEAIRTA